MDKNLFEEFEDRHWHDAVDDCYEDYYAGLQECEIFYCPAVHVTPFAIPRLEGTFESAGTIKENITCKNRRSFEKINALVDQNELTGDVSETSSKTSVNLYVLGLKGSRIGLSRKVSRYPGIYILRDANGRMWIVGNTLSPAFASFNLTTGKVEEDNSGVQMKLSSNMIFFEYTGSIPPYRESDFSDEFSFEFF